MRFEPVYGEWPRSTCLIKGTFGSLWKPVGKMDVWKPWKPEDGCLEASGSRKPRGYTLGESYLVRAEPILKKQMARASVRLANELNAIFH
jgi:hypothetical protein